MKKKNLFKIEEKLKVLQSLTNEEAGRLLGGEAVDPPPSPTPTPVPVVTFSYSPPPQFPPVTYTPPSGVGVTIKF